MFISDSSTSSSSASSSSGSGEETNTSLESDSTTASETSVIEDEEITEIGKRSPRKRVTEKFHPISNPVKDQAGQKKKGRGKKTKVDKVPLAKGPKKGAQKKAKKAEEKKVQKKATPTKKASAQLGYLTGIQNRITKLNEELKLTKDILNKAKKLKKL